MLKIEGRSPSLHESLQIAAYPIKHPELMAHDAIVAARRAFEEKFLVPGKIEEIHDPIVNTNIRHLGIITDKNGTWAEDRGLPRWVGYLVSAGHLTNSVIRARESGLTEISAWGASPLNIDNRKPEVMQEVFNAIEPTVVKLAPKLKTNGGRFHAKGRTDRLPGSLQNVIEEAERLTEDNRDYDVNLYIDANNENDEMALIEGLESKIVIDPKTKEPITPDIYMSGDLAERRRLMSILTHDTQTIPDVDVLIRTGVSMDRNYPYVYLSDWGRSAQNASIYPRREPLPELRTMTVLRILEAATKEERRQRVAGGVRQKSETRGRRRSP